MRRFFGLSFTFLCLFLSLQVSCAPPAGSCSGDDDCLFGEECIRGFCREGRGPECQRDSDCKSGEECRSNSCVKASGGCRSDADCGSGEECSNGSCRRRSGGCSSNSDCSRGQACENGACVTQKSKATEGQPCPSGVSDCVSGLVCVIGASLNATCQRRCAKSSDCSGGFYCYGLKGGGAACFKDMGPPRDYRYKVRIISARVTERDPNGSAWDTFGGLPDLKVWIFVAGKTYSTSEESDSTSASWNYTTPDSFTASDISAMSVKLYDVDPVDDDLIIEGVKFKITKAKGNVFEFTNQALGVISLKVEVIGVPE